MWVAEQAVLLAAWRGAEWVALKAVVMVAKWEYP